MCDNEAYCASKDDFTREKKDYRKPVDHQSHENTYEFEDALNIVGHGGYNRWLLVVLMVVLFASAMDMFGFAILVFGCSCDFHLTLPQMSILNSMPFIGPIFMAYAWGYLSDTQGRRKSLLYSLAGGIVVTLISCFSPNWIFLAVAKLVSVSFTCCVQSTAYTLIGESCTQKTRGGYMMVLTSAVMICQTVFFSLGYLILPLKFSYDMGVLGRFVPWRLLALVLMLPQLIGFSGLLAFHESPKFLVSQGRQKEALEVMKDMWRRNGGSPAMFPIKKINLTEQNSEHTHPSSSHDSFLRSLWQQTAPLFKPPLLKRTLQLFYLAVANYSISNGVVSWFPSILNKFFSSTEGGKHGLCNLISNTTDTRTSSVDKFQIEEPCVAEFEESTVLAGVAFGICCLSTNLVLSLIPGRRKVIAIMANLVSGLSGIALLYTSQPILTMVFYFALIMISMTIGPISMYYVDLYPTSHRGMVACLGVVVARCSSLLGTNVVGAFLMTHCDVTFYGASAFALSHGSYSNGLFALMSFMLTSMALDMYSVNTLIVGGSCEFNLTMPQKSLLAAMPLIGPLVMSYPWGYILDTQGRRRSMVIAMSMACFFSALSAFSPNWIMLGVLKTFSTGFSSCAQSSTYTLLGESCIERLRGFYMLVMCSIMTSVLLCTNMVSYFILAPDYAYDMGILGLWTPWRSFAVFVAVPLGLSALMLLRYNESPKFLLNAGREKEALVALRDIWTRNGGEPDAYPVQKLTLGVNEAHRREIPLLKSLWEQVVPLFKPPLLYRTLQLYFVCSVIYSTLSGFYIWYPFIFNAFFLTLKSSTGGDHGICDMLAIGIGDASSLNNTAISSHQVCSNKMELSTAIASVCQALIYALLTLCVYKFSSWKRRLLVGFMLLAAVGGFGVTLTPEPVSAILFFLTFSMHGLTTGILSSYFVDLFPTSHRGMVACLSVIVARCSMLAASAVIGGCILTHCKATFFAFSLYILCGVVAIWFLPCDKVAKQNDK